MKKKIILAVVIFILLSLGIGLFLLNKMIVPNVIRPFIISKLEEATEKKAAMSSFEFSLFSGLVVKDFSLSDDGKVVLKIEEMAGKFSLLQLLAKQTVINLLLRGIDYDGRKIDEFKGVFKITGNTASSDNLRMKVSGLSIKIKFKLEDFSDPLVNADIYCDTDLTVLETALKEQLDFSLPGKLRGQGKVDVNVSKQLSQEQGLKLGGFVEVKDADFQAADNKFSFEGMTGKLLLNSDEIECPKIQFKYADIVYDLSGKLKDFLNPQGQVALSSEDLEIKTDFNMDKEIVRVTKFKGRFMDSRFLLYGDIDMGGMTGFDAGITGTLDIDLKNIKEIAAKTAEKKLFEVLDKISPKGVVHADISLSGDLRDTLGAGIGLKLSCAELSIYGFNASDFFMEYKQQEKKGLIENGRLSFYDGGINFSGKTDFDSADLPFSSEINIEKVKVDKLKMDTAAKDKDISGVLSGRCAFAGRIKQIAALTGDGNICVSEGNLWQIDTSKGLAALVFSGASGNVVFNKAECDFIVKDKYFSTNNLKLESNVSDITGALKIGFNGALDGRLKVEESSKEDAEKGELADIADILATASKMGEIKVSGTLKKPRFNYKPVAAVKDIFEDLGNIFFGK